MSEKSLEELEFEETGVTRKERWKIMWASIIGYAMDGLDVLILSFAMAAIVSEFGLSLGEGGLIATYTLIGTVLGGYLFGIFADYFGRVHTFSLTIIIFSIFTGACAFADNVTHLDILRFLAGLGLGGEYGIGMTLVRMFTSTMIDDLAGGKACPGYGRGGYGLAGRGCAGGYPGGFCSTGLRMERPVPGRCGTGTAGCLGSPRPEGTTDVGQEKGNEEGPSGP